MHPTKIDHEQGILYDVVMVEEGEAKGHGVHLDGEFVSNLVQYDNKHYKKNGIKARFGHPSASSETMGTQMGVFKNIRERETKGKMQAIADLHLLEAADESPTHPGMRSWVLKMAEEQPDFIMSSIVFQASGYYIKKGEKKHAAQIDYTEWSAKWVYETEDGQWEPIKKNEKIFVAFDEKDGAAHLYTDLVEQGAATDNLFSTKVNTHLFAAQVDEFLSEHPHLLEFIKQNPAAVQKWMQRAGYNVTAKMEKFSIMKWLKGESQNAEPDTTDMSELRTALTAAQTEIAQLRQERDDFEAKFKAADARATQLQADAAALKTSLEELKTQVTSLTEQLSTISKTAADKPTGGDTPPAGGGESKDRAYKSNPLNKHIYAC